MDKLENEHKPEEVLNYASKPYKHSPEIDPKENLQKDHDTKPWLELRWKRLIQWLRDSTSTPEWLPAPWNHPISAYIFALLIPLITTLLTLLLRYIFLTFVFPGLLIVIAIMVV